jgi:hypothetical protein
MPTCSCPNQSWCEQTKPFISYGSSAPLQLTFVNTFKLSISRAFFTLSLVVNHYQMLFLFSCRLETQPTIRSCSSIRQLLYLYGGHIQTSETSMLSSIYDNSVEDKEAVKILTMFHPIVLADCSHRAVTGDGNCMYRSASFGLYGTQEWHAYVRLITAMEIIEHRDTYDAKSLRFQSTLYDSRLIVSPYEKLVADAVKIGSWAEMMHVYALSSAFGVVVESYLPPTSARCSGYNMYTCSVSGRGVRNTSQPKFTLMWSSAKAPKCRTDFHVNHIVLLAHKRQPDVTPLSSDDEDCMTDSYDAEVEKYYSEQQFDTNCSTDTCNDLTDKHGQEFDAGSESYMPVPEQTDEIGNCSETTAEQLVGSVPLPRDDGLSTAEVMDILTSSTYIHVERVPNGSKNNVYFLVSNAANIKRKANKSNCAFDDDCGVWVQERTVINGSSGSQVDRSTAKK